MQKIAAEPLVSDGVFLSMWSEKRWLPLAQEDSGFFIRIWNLHGRFSYYLALLVTSES